MDVNNTPAESSSAGTPVIEVPREPKAYQEWRQTGKVGESAAKQPKAESAPAKESSAPVTGESEPASEAANDKQEKREKPRSNAESRLKELLEDLKNSGLSPAELKTFKKQAQAEAQPKTEHTEKPAEAPQAPTWEDRNPKPKLENHDSLEAFTEALTDWKLSKSDFDRAQREAAEKQQREVNEMLSKARERYGDEADSSIRAAAKDLFGDTKIPSAVKAILNDSPVMVDLLYTLGKGEELKAFSELAKANPGAAIRKAVVIEGLIQAELSGASKHEAAGEAPRDESGKFAKTTPAKKVTEAPPPPREASGRSAAPPDEVESAAKANDFTSFRNAANRRDLARHQGR